MYISFFMYMNVRVRIFFSSYIHCIHVNVECNLCARVYIQEGDYPAATQLCIECQKAIETYKLFCCVRYMYSIYIVNVHSTCMHVVQYAPQKRLHSTHDCLDQW